MLKPLTDFADKINSIGTQLNDVSENLQRTSGLLYQVIEQRQIMGDLPAPVNVTAPPN